MNILAVDTSCDETSASVCKNDWVLSNIVSSQIDLHKKWRGVVPIIAKRAHKEKIGPVIDLALKRAGLKIEKIDIFAVTVGPGLAIALEVGIEKVKEFSKRLGKPIILVNHMEGHIYSNLAKNSKGNYYGNIEKLELPMLSLLVSGGHTEIVIMKDHGEYEVIGSTLDDAVGEAFDKVARPLMLGYPGGPIIEEFAKNGNPNRFELPIPMVRRRDYNFSYSGLKTACVIKIKKLKKKHGDNFNKIIPDFCASFQKTVADSLLLKLEKVAEENQFSQLLLGGGVISNIYLRRKIRKSMRKHGIKVITPSKKLCTDNAAMIGICAYYKSERKEFVKNIEKIDRLPNLRIDEKINF